LSVQELSGRTVQYAYDDLYRLTSETIADAAPQNGTVSYQYDAVGNRKQLNSTLPAVPTGLLNYDANDRISTQVYDNNGNTINNGLQNVYDFENRLVQRGNVQIVYDGDGNRVQETVAGQSVFYLVADVNPTGYPQVLEEQDREGVPERKHYIWGLQGVGGLQRITVGSGFATQDILVPFYFGLDGHGSVRYLTDPNGVVTDTYDYDAFGNLIAQTGATQNNYLFGGEQFDPALGVYYNRARYFDQRLGRFWSMDLLEAFGGDPAALHKYTYAQNDPANRRDPSGYVSVLEETEVVAVENIENVIPLVNPAVAGGAVALAETAATISQVQVALYWVLQASLIAAPVVAAVLPTDAPNETDEQRRRRSDNRGRLQVQGGDIANKNFDLSGHAGFNYSDDTLSWPWSQPTPLLSYTALSRLSEFLQVLTKDQIKRRATAFVNASRFIVNASLGGGTGPTKKTFNDNNALVPDARVDIEVQTGRAFVPF
jgi:RHS repeat-associated protein